MNLRNDIHQSGQLDIADINELIAYGRRLRSEYLAMQARRLLRRIRSAATGYRGRGGDIGGTATAR